MEQNFDINDPKIYLRNGSILQCYPLAPTEEHNLHPCRNRDEWNHSEKQFCENAFLFLANADLIFSDSRMFLAQVNVHNGLAYSGGFAQGCLGGYLEWWIYGRYHSIDKKGRPIWFISGSPLSGSHACLAADEDGKLYKAELPHGLMACVKSWHYIHKDYREAQKHCQAFTIEEVIEILQGKDSIASKERVHTMLEFFKMENKIQELQDEVEDTHRAYCNAVKRIQLFLWHEYHDELVEYYNQSVNLETVADLKEQYFKEQRIELRKALKQEQLTQKEYQKKYTQLRKEAEEARWEWSQFRAERLGEILGDDNGWLHPKDVDDFILKNYTNKGDKEQ